MSFYNLSNGVHVGFPLTFFDSQELEPDVGGGWKALKNDGWALLPMVVAQPCQTVKQSNSLRSNKLLNSPRIVSGAFGWVAHTHLAAFSCVRLGPKRGFFDFNLMHLD